MIKYLYVLVLVVVLLSCSTKGKDFFLENGIDVSHYQGDISWPMVADDDIDFVFIRASMGSDCKDSRFDYNLREANRVMIVTGVYHYYRPNENSIMQANNFIRIIRNMDYDLPPVVDIESASTIQSIDSLIVGIQRFCDKVEKEIGVKPIIYTGDKFYEVFLRGKFEGYTLWIANYSRRPITRFKYWQKTQRGKVKGIKGFVDLNIIENEFTSRQ